MMSCRRSCKLPWEGDRPVAEVLPSNPEPSPNSRDGGTGEHIPRGKADGTRALHATPFIWDPGVRRLERGCGVAWYPTGFGTASKEAEKPATAVQIGPAPLLPVACCVALVEAGTFSCCVQMLASQISLSDTSPERTHKYGHGVQAGARQPDACLRTTVPGFTT